VSKCPGSLGFSQPKPEEVSCPTCGKEVEIWSDEAMSRCRSCGKIVIRADTQSCIDWCRYAKDCLGADGYRQYGEMKAAMRKAALQEALAPRLTDADPSVVFGRVVLRYAEQLCSRAGSSDPGLVVSAAVLLQLTGTGDDADGRSADLSEIRSVLEPLGYGEPFDTDVCNVLAEVAAGQPATAESINAEIILDAILLATQERRLEAGDPMPPETVVARCRTPQATSIAIEMRKFHRADASDESGETA